jgi:tRNA modification GTPase
MPFKSAAPAIEKEIQGILPKVTSRKAVLLLLGQRLSLQEQFPDNASLIGKGLSRSIFRWVEELNRSGKSEIIRDEIKSALSTYPPAALLADPPAILMTGPPNSGKSTLANRLLARRISIVTDRPGTTRDWVAEEGRISGWPVKIIDTAGIYEIEGKKTDEALSLRDGIDRESINRAIAKQVEANLLLVIIDSSRQLTEQLEFIRNVPHRKRTLLAVNKIDLPGVWSADSLPGSLASLPLVRISAEKGEGIDDLERKICERLGFDLLNRAPEVVFTQRQKKLLTEAKNGIQEGKIQVARDALKRCLSG